MVTYNYSVSQGGPTTSIQFAIDRVCQELASNPLIERDIEIEVGPGTYAGFTIPNGSLYPLFNTGYRLVIKSIGDNFPIIDFNYSNEDNYVGIDIGSGNPNVTIKGLRIQYFAVGIRAGLNSHYPIVHNCIVNNNRNAGIFFEQTYQAQALQNIVVNGDYGIVVRLCKSASIIHNTIFMNGAISTESGKSISCIWAELANDYGNGLNDTGILHMLGNVAWNTSGRCLTLFAEDVERAGSIFSNYNDFVIGDPDNFIVIEDNAFYRGAESRPRRVLTDLTSWKALGFDPDSKSEDPRFISPVKIKKGRNGFALDLNILPVSPVLELSPSFAYNTTYRAVWFPSYVDSSVFTKDILNKNRSQDFTAAGANDKTSTSGFFGQDIFSNPLDLGLTKNCATDPFFNILFKNLDIWFPTYKRGYFYSNEREYYLYSKKECKNIGELARTSFNLPAKISHSRPIQVYVNGKKLSDSKYYDLFGFILNIYHLDLLILNGEEEVEIQGYISNWNGTSFVYNQVLYRFKFNEGQTKFFLPSNYVPVGPVVVTDDITYPTDSDYITNREYCLKFDKEEQKSELIFANYLNQLFNGQFDYLDSNNAPIGWQSSNASVVTAQAPYYAAAGKNVCSIQNDGYIKKFVPIAVSGLYTLSLHAMSAGSGVCDYHFEYYDINYDSIGYSQTGSFSLKNDWTRYSIEFGPTGYDDGHVVPQLPYPCLDLGRKFVPDNAAHVSFKLTHNYNPAYTGSMLLSALQFEESPGATLYHRKFFLNEMTVEYETSTDDFYIDTHQAIAPVRNLNFDGFFYIPELPAATFGGPDTPVVTTLHEWKWQDGRKHVLPWARTKGKDKLRKRTYNKFHLIPQLKPEQIAPVNFTASIKDIEIYPSTPVALIGNDNGVGFSIKVIDSDNNPYANNSINIELIDYNLKYPGMLLKHSYGLKEQLSTYISTKTDSSGSVALRWVPPTEIDTVYVGEIPVSEFSNNNGDNICVIKTQYPVYTNYNGNVIILDYLGNTLKTKADNAIQADYESSYGTDTSSIRLEYPIAPGSVKVKVLGKSYTESQINLLDSDQFFVDYENSIITVKGRVANINVEYVPSYIYVTQSDPYSIYIYSDKVFLNYTNTISVGYDILLKLAISIKDYASNSFFNQEFELVGQNPLMKKKSYFNTIAFDF